jgi:hypothetical protein
VALGKRYLADGDETRAVQFLDAALALAPANVEALSLKRELK